MRVIRRFVAKQNLQTQFVFSYDQAALWTVLSVCPPVFQSVRPEFSGVITIDKSDVQGKGHGQRWKVKVTEVKINFDLIWAILEHNSSWNSQMASKRCTKFIVALKRVSGCFQDHPWKFNVTRSKQIANFDLNWAFRNCKSNLNSQMAMKWCRHLCLITALFHRAWQLHNIKSMCITNLLNGDVMSVG